MWTRLFLTLLSWSACAVEAQPSFEAASVRRADPNAAMAPGAFGGVQMLPGGRFVGARVTLFTLLQRVYGVKGFQISGGPGWLRSEPYDIQAKDATQCGGNGCFQVGNGFLTASGGTMAFTAEVLTRLLDRPALDKTGLSGHYDFKLTYDQSSVKAPVVGMSNAPTDGPSIFAAIEDLGLKLNPEKDPIEILVMDSVERPGAN